MKLIRFGEAGMEKPGLLVNDKIVDVSSFGKDFTPSFFAQNGLQELSDWVEKNQTSVSTINDPVRMGTPVSGIGKIVCVGLNYKDHAEESNMALPKEPIIFFKASSSIVGPNDDLIIPKNSSKTDWEVELGVVIGKKASYVSEVDAMDYVAGYVLHNDYSEREFQLERSGQWVKGKSCDTFAPIGPWLVTKDEIEDVSNLNLWLKVNGETMQNGNTSNLIFSVPYLVSYISQFMSLLPGDIISTGTPAGVGLGMKPPVYLKAGDEIELGIEGLGTSKQTAKAYAEIS